MAIGKWKSEYGYWKTEPQKASDRKNPYIALREAKYYLNVSKEVWFRMGEASELNTSSALDGPSCSNASLLSHNCEAKILFKRHVKELKSLQDDERKEKKLSHEQATRVLLDAVYYLNKLPTEYVIEYRNKIDDLTSSICRKQFEEDKRTRREMEQERKSREEARKVLFAAIPILRKLTPPYVKKYRKQINDLVTEIFFKERFEFCRKQQVRETLIQKFNEKNYPYRYPIQRLYSDEEAQRLTSSNQPSTSSDVR